MKKLKPNYIQVSLTHIIKQLVQSQEIKVEQKQDIRNPTNKAKPSLITSFPPTRPAK